MESQREEEATLTPAQLLQLAESHLRLRNFSLCREYALESHHPNDPHRHHNHHRAAQLIAVADILSAASAAPPGLTNWYSVLQVDTFSNDLTLVRTQFKKLLRLLESINGRLSLAGEALNLVSKAYENLSNPTLKAQLDSQLALVLSNQKHVNGDGGGAGSGSFWTFCPYCFYVYEYDKVYEGCCLRCQNETCRRAFHGVSLCSLPRMELEKGQYFGCFGYFPLGFSPCEGEAKAKFGSWSPIVGLFPVRRVRKTCAGRMDLDDDNGHNNNSNAHCVEILDDSDESEAPQHENENQQVGMNMEGPNVGVGGDRPRMVKKKTVAWNAKKLMGKGRNNEGASDPAERSEYGHADETYDFGSVTSVHDAGMGSGCGLDGDGVKFFEEDGEIFVGLGPDGAL